MLSTDSEIENSIASGYFDSVECDHNSEFVDYFDDIMKKSLLRFIYKNYPKSDRNMWIEDQISRKEKEDNINKLMPFLCKENTSCICDDNHCPHKGTINSLAAYLMSFGPSARRTIYLNDWEFLRYPIFNIGPKLATQLLLAVMQCVNNDPIIKDIVSMNAIRCKFNIKEANQFFSGEDGEILSFHL